MIKDIIEGTTSVNLLEFDKL